MVEVIAAGRLCATGALNPAIFSASAADRTTCGVGCCDQVTVPYSLSADSDWISATETGIACTVVGWNSGRMLANAVTTSAASTTAAARPTNIGREAGRMIGRLNPNRGFAAGAACTRLNADATSTLSSGVASMVVAARASSAIPVNRAWQSAQS